MNYGVSAIGDIITTPGLRGGGETLGGFSVHHASAVFGGGPWEFAIYAQNLLDKYAVTGIRSRRDMVQTELDDGRQSGSGTPLCAADAAPARSRLPFHL